MYQIEVETEGISPILFNPFLNPEKLGIKPGGVRKSVKDELKDAAKKCHFSNGIICCPALNIKSAMIGAASLSNLKYGKKSITPFMRAWMFIEPDMILFEPNRMKPDFIDSRVAVNRNMGKGTAILVHRPGLNPGWKLNFVIRIMDDRLPMEHVETALKEAGILTAIGSFRPEFGRFQVNKFTKV